MDKLLSIGIYPPFKQPVLGVWFVNPYPNLNCQCEFQNISAVDPQ